MYIEIDKKSVKLSKMMDSKVLARLPLTIIDQTIEDGLSNWVIHISQKTWSDIDGLYELAVVICGLSPENSIDWEATFFCVEKTGALNEALKLDDSVKYSGYAGAMKMMELGQKFMVDGTDIKLKQRVAEHLELYGIK